MWCRQGVNQFTVNHSYCLSRSFCFRFACTLCIIHGVNKALKWTRTQPLWFQTHPEGQAMLSAVYMRLLSLRDKWGNMQSLSCKHPVVDTELTASPKRLWLGSQWEYGPEPKQSGRERERPDREKCFSFPSPNVSCNFQGWKLPWNPAIPSFITKARSWHDKYPLKYIIAYQAKYETEGSKMINSQCCSSSMYCLGCTAIVWRLTLAFLVWINGLFGLHNCIHNPL